MVLTRNSSISFECGTGRTDEVESPSLEGIEFEIEKPVFKKPIQTTHTCSCRKYAGKRTLLELYLIIVSFVFFIAFIFTVGILAHLRGFNGYIKNEVHTISTYCPVEDNKTNTSITCVSAECEREAGRILSSMDFAVEPCNDFYQFACGSFLKYQTPSEIAITDRFTLIRDDTQSLIRKLLEEPRRHNESKFIPKLKKFYRSCVIEPSQWTLMGLVNDLVAKTKLFPWPVLEEYESITKEITIEYTLATVRVFGGGAPIFLLDKIGLSNKTLLELSFGESLFSNIFSTRRRFPSAVNDTSKYESLLTYIFLKLQIPPEKATSEAAKLMRFARLLAHIKRRRTRERKSPSKITAMSISGLEVLCPQFQWTKYITHLNENFDYSEHLNPQIPVIINHIEYTLAICKLLGNTNIRTIYNYIVWNLIGSYIPFFDNYILNEVSEISNHRKLWNVNNKRWKNCLSLLSQSHVAPALDYLVIKYWNTNQSLKEVATLIEEMKSVLEDTVHNIKWLGEKAKTLAKIELEKINYVVGYEKYAMNETHLNILFSKINFTDIFLDNVLAEAKLSFSSSFYRNSPNYNSLTSNPLEPPAKFSFISRTLFIPAGIIQQPFFRLGSPRYLNYGGIGSVIAHELIHSLWKLGQIFQEKGNGTHKEIIEAIRKLNKRKECFSRQYSQFPLGKDGLKINGVRTLEENIADSSGIIQAFRAYEKKVEQCAEQKLPRLEYTNLQMFFIQYAQTMCEIVEDPKRSYVYENHSMKKYRVLGSLQNFPRFSEIFGCKKGSPMNPEEKCELWA